MKKNSLILIVVILAVAGIIYSFFSFGEAFPIVNVKITADKNQVMRAADSLSQVHSIMQGDYRSVAVFDTDTRFKNYVELEGGGVEVFQDIVNSEIYHPYTWQVRQYNLNDIYEAYYVFSPNGDFLGFKIILPDSLKGANIEEPKLDAIWAKYQGSVILPDLSDYELIETSSELKESGRRDHVLTYELKNAQIAEAHYRLKIGISGDVLSMVMPMVKIPETFDIRYEEMRSANTTIAFVGQAIMLLLYALCGVALAIFFMIRKRILLWKPALTWAIIIGVLIFMAQLTTISLSWFNYDTSLSSGQFIFQQILSALVNGLLISVIFFVSASAGEGLGRQAFPGQIQFWRSWSPTVGASKEIMRHTVFGYLWAFFMVGFITFFYWITNHVFHWWSPADNMVDPNVLALPFPWLLPSAQALQAGFWEETLFRAVPLAGALLIAKKWKKKGLWLAFALIAQAAIFGAMHANYPQQPAYARIIEMIIPFVLYGLIYINWGLLPVVISHFVYDIVLMALPLFLLKAPGIWLHRLLAVVAMLIPLIVIIYRRAKAGSWYQIKEEDLNSGFVVPEPKKDKEVKKVSGETIAHKELPITLAIILIIAGATLWFFMTPFEQDIPKLGLDKSEAIAISDAFVEQYYPGTDSLGLKPYVNLISGKDKGSRFVWENSNRDLFRKLYKKDLASSYYTINYKTFDGNVVTRSETIEFHVTKDGEIASWFHNVPEPRPGAHLEEAKAKKIAEQALMNYKGMDVSLLELVKLTPEKRKARTDWSIEYRDLNTGLEVGDIRYVVNLAGDEVCGMKTYVHSTESWDREQKKANVLKTVLFAITKVIQFGMLITVLVFAVIAWTKKDFNVKIFIPFLIGFIFISLAQGALMSKMIIAQYPTSEPFSNLMLMLVISLLIGAVFSGFLYALPIGYIVRVPLHIQRNESVIGVKGSSLGLVLAGVIAFAQGNFLNQAPVMIAPFDLQSISPLLSSFLNALEGYFIAVISLMVPFLIAERISGSWQKQKAWTILILMLSGFSLVGRLDLGMWLIAGGICGLVMVALYIWVLRFNMIYIPVMAGTIILLELLQYAIVNPAVHTLSYVIITAITTILLSVLVVWAMHMLRILQPKKAGKGKE